MLRNFFLSKTICKKTVKLKIFFLFLIFLLAADQEQILATFFHAAKKCLWLLIWKRHHIGEVS